MWHGATHEVAISSLEKPCLESTKRDANLEVELLSSVNREAFVALNEHCDKHDAVQCTYMQSIFERNTLSANFILREYVYQFTAAAADAHVRAAKVFKRREQVRLAKR